MQAQDDVGPALPDVAHEAAEEVGVGAPVLEDLAVVPGGGHEHRRGAGYVERVVRLGEGAVHGGAQVVVAGRAQKVAVVGVEAGDLRPVLLVPRPEALPGEVGVGLARVPPRAPQRPVQPPELLLTVRALPPEAVPQHETLRRGAEEGGAVVHDGHVRVEAGDADQVVPEPPLDEVGVQGIQVVHPLLSEPVRLVHEDLDRDPWPVVEVLGEAPEVRAEGRGPDQYVHWQGGRQSGEYGRGESVSPRMSHES